MRASRLAFASSLSKSGPFAGVAASVLLAVGLGLDSQAVHAPETGPQEEDPLPFPGRVDPFEQLKTDLVGYWRLMRFQHPTNNIDNYEVRGFLSVDDVYLTFLVHATPLSAGLFTSTEPLIQAGVHHWQINTDGILQTSAVISHTNFDGPLQFEPNFTPREFQVNLGGADLTLTRPDGATLLFERITPTGFPQAAVDQIEAERRNKGGQAPR